MSPTVVLEERRAVITVRERQEVAVVVVVLASPEEREVGIVVVGGVEPRRGAGTGGDIDEFVVVLAFGEDREVLVVVVEALLAEEEDEPGTENLHYNQQDNTTVALPTGYTRCTLIDRNALLTAYAPSDSLLVVPLEGMSDTVRLPLDTLRTRDLHPQLPLPPPLFRTQGDRILLLNTFHIYLDKKKPEAEVRLTGYLFSH